MSKRPYANTIIREKNAPITMEERLLLVENKDFTLFTKLLSSMLTDWLYMAGIITLIVLSFFSQWFWIRQISLLYIIFLGAFLFYSMWIEHKAQKEFQTQKVYFLTPTTKKIMEGKITLAPMTEIHFVIWCLAFLISFIPFIIGFGIVAGSWATAIFFGLCAFARIGYDFYYRNDQHRYYMKDTYQDLQLLLVQE